MDEYYAIAAFVLMAGFGVFIFVAKSHEQKRRIAGEALIRGLQVLDIKPSSRIRALLGKESLYEVHIIGPDGDPQIMRAYLTGHGEIFWKD